MPSNVILIAKAKDRAHQLPRAAALPALLPVAIAVVSLVSLLLLVQTSGITTTSYDIKRLKQERDDWQQANYQLESEIARLQSLDRVDKEARTKLKMVPASDYLFVTVKEVPSRASGDFSPPAHAKRADSQSEDTSLTQQLLDWLGSVLGLRHS